MRRKRGSRAVPALTTALPIRSSRRRIILLAAALAILAGAWLLRQPLTANQANVERYLHGANLARRGDYDGAAQVWELLRRDAPAYPDPSLALATHYTNMGHIPQAVGVLHDLLRADPAAPGAYTVLAEAYAKATDWPEALPAAKKAVAADPHSAAAHAALAVAWGQNFSLDKARAEIASAQRLNPANPDYYLRAALIERDAEQYPTSEAQARLCLARDSHNAAAWNVLGWAIRHQPATPARTAAALDAYTQACRNDATLTPAFVERAALLLELGQPDQALTALQTARALAAVPDVSGRYTQKHLQTRIRIDSLLLRVPSVRQSTRQFTDLMRDMKTLDVQVRSLPPALRARN